MNRKSLIGVSALGLAVGLFVVSGQIVPAIGDAAEHKSVTPSAQKIANNGFVIPGLETRESRRAFYSAPPVIPHRLGKNVRECLSCHRGGREFKGNIAPLTPHPQFTNCRQCHVRGTSPKFITQPQKTAKTSWQGLANPGQGTRQHEFAPPTIPHRSFLREDCIRCHNPGAVSTPKLPREHSQRTNCRQCHVQMDKSLDF